MEQPRTAATVLVCDIDGVVYPYMEKMRARVQSMFPVRHIPEAAEYNLTKAWGITEEDQQKAHLTLFSGAVIHGAEPITGAPEALWHLHRHGVEIIFATRRAHYTAMIGGNFEDAVALTKQWLNGWAPPHEVLFVDRKAQIDREFDLMLEDNPKEARPIREQGRWVWLLDQPYNREAHELVRFSWGDFSTLGMTLPETLGIPDPGAGLDS